MSWLGNLFGLDDDTKQVLHEVYLTNKYATELDYGERCAEAANETDDEEDQQMYRSDSRGGYTEAYHAKQELTELGREIIEEEEEEEPWWKVW